MKVMISIDEDILQESKILSLRNKFPSFSAFIEYLCVEALLKEGTIIERSREILTIDPAVMQCIKIKAAMEETTVSSIVEDALLKALNAKEEHITKDVRYAKREVFPVRFTKEVLDKGRRKAESMDLSFSVYLERLIKRDTAGFSFEVEKNKKAEETIVLEFGEIELVEEK